MHLWTNLACDRHLFCGPPSQGLGIQTMEKHRAPVAMGVRVIKSGFLKAEQTYGDLRVNTAGKKAAVVTVPWYYWHITSHTQN